MGNEPEFISTRDARRLAHDKSRGRFVDELRLEHHETTMCPTFTLVKYWWPASAQGASQRYDRPVYVIVYDDGSWTAALDDGWIKIDDTIAAFRRMAIAAEAKE